VQVNETHTTLFAIKGSNNKKKQRKRSEINNYKISQTQQQLYTCTTRTQTTVNLSLFVGLMQFTSLRFIDQTKKKLKVQKLELQK